MHQHDPLDLIQYALHRNSWRWETGRDVQLEGFSIPKTISVYLQHLYVTRYLIVASFALGYYDSFLTLAQERTYIWRSRPSAVRSIYLFLRYSYFPIGILTLYEKTGSAPAGGLSDMFCRIWFITEMTWQFFITASVQCLMLLRVSAYWGPDYPSVKKGLILLYILCSIGTACLQMLAVSKFYPSKYKYSPELNTCATIPPKITSAYYAPYLLMESILFALTFCKWFMVRKSHPGRASIIHIFFRDGMVYFAIIFVMAAWSLVTYLWLPFSLVGSAYYPSYTLTTLCACRLVLSIRAAHNTSANPTSESGVQFDHDAINIELNERDSGSRGRGTVTCSTPSRQSQRIRSPTIRSISSLEYDKRTGTALSMDLPTVEEALDKIEEGNGPHVCSLRTRFTTPAALQRSDPMRDDSKGLVEGGTLMSLDDWFR